MAVAPDECDLAVVGGGILGLAVTRELKRRRPDLNAVVLEAGSIRTWSSGFRPTWSNAMLTSSRTLFAVFVAIT